MKHTFIFLAALLLAPLAALHAGEPTVLLRGTVGSELGTADIPRHGCMLIRVSPVK